MKNDSVLKQFEKDWDLHLGDLKTLIKIPSVSFDGFDPKIVHQCGERVAQLLKDRGLENVQYLKVEGAAPYIYGDWLHAPGKPTVLLYAHYDVQPPGRENLWESSPFEPTIRQGPGGDRLFARGAADDKAGIVAQTAAIFSYLKTEKKLPINIKFIVEGEEEIGSPNLEKFVNQYQDKLAADVLMLSDTTNFDVGIPALTVSLRGLVGFELEVRSLNKTVHSGMWSGPVPDPAMALTKILSTLIDQNGNIALKELTALAPKLTAEEEKFFKEIPFNRAEFADQVGLVGNATLFHEGAEAWKSLWRQPSLTINAMEAGSRRNAGNIINDTAWARVTLRVAPGMDPEKCRAVIEKHLKQQTPWGLELRTTWEESSPGWSADPESYHHPAFKAAERALELGYGKKPIKMGCGGSIPFVRPFVQILRNAPALLIGVEDPYTNAHGENESLAISDFKKSCLSQIFLFAELGK